MATLFVLDTNVLVAGLWSRTGAASKVLEIVRAGRAIPALSVPLVLEYEMVLRRRAVDLGLTEAQISGFLDYLCRIGLHQEIRFLWRPSLRDPRDELVLELAVACQSRYVVTHNVRDFAGSETFGVSAIRPAQFLEIMGAQR